MRQLFEPLLWEASAAERDDLLQGPARLAARVLGLPGALEEGEAPAASPDASFTVLHGLYWLCANLAADRLLVLSVDDAHWADTSSLRFLTYLLARLEELKIALLVATRPEGEAEEAHLLATLTADPHADVVHPAPLSADAAGRLVEARLGAVPDAAFTAACHRATGGVPFLVRELLEALAAEGMSPDARTAARVEAVGARTARRWIQLRLGRLPAPAARLARAVAVLERAQLPRAAALAELDAAAGRRGGRRRWWRQASSSPSVRWPSCTRSCARASTRSCRSPSARSLTAARPSSWTTIPPARSAPPSTCWPPSRLATRGSRGGWSTRPAPRRGAARPSPPPCSCAAPWPSRRLRPSGPGSCSSSGSPRPPPARPPARTTCARRSTPPATTSRASRSGRRSCSRMRSGARSGSRTRWRWSTARRRGCGRPTSRARSCSRRWR